MKKIQYFSALLAFLILPVLVSCDFLDVSKELAHEQTLEQVFNDPTDMRRFHRYIFTGIPDYSNMFFAEGSDFGLQNPWTGLTDECDFQYDHTDNSCKNGYHSGSSPYHRWSKLYRIIRQANMFLREAHTIMPLGNEVDYVNEEELQELKAQARFLRAYYYYLLFELYGPVPLITEVLDPYTSELDYPRNSVDEVVDFICNEMTDLINEEGGLREIETEEERLALPTKGVAMAVRAKARILAASPLYNGGYAEALALTNADGKRLFPDYDKNKWNIALEAIQAFIDFSNGKYDLFKIYGKDGSYDPDASLYELFMSYNNEIIWASSKTWFNPLTSTYGYDKYSTPFSEIKGLQRTAVTQELVDDFFMKDGLSIEESPLYLKDGSGFTKVDGVEIYNEWIDREPRFYQTVFYQGRKWHVKNNVIYFYNGSANGVDKQPLNYPNTGYLLYKRCSRKIYNQGTNPKVHYRPSIIFRLAEFYLLYAETLNEVNPSDPRILEYVDKVRERAGIPKLTEIKPEIVGDYNAQAEAIRRESRVELCTEGQRYFDVRRWMLAETEGYKQGDDFYGMNMFGVKGDKNAFYERVVSETRMWDKKYYLHPIPFTEIQNSRKLVQNPGW